MQSESFTISLAFCRSSSVHYPTALNLARGFDGYCEEDDDGALVHSVLLSDEMKHADQFSRFISLVKIVSSWKGTVFTVCGEVMPSAAIDRLIHVGECYQRQRRSGNPYHYCNGFDPRHAPTYFGCRLLTSVNRYVPHNGEHHQSDRTWYRHGEIRGSTFHVDKQKILTVLTDEAEELFTRACPVFSIAAVAEEVASLPDVIDVQNDTRWLTELKPNGSVGVRLKTVADRRRRMNGETGSHREKTDDGDGRKNGHGLPAESDGEQQDDVRVIPDVRFTDVGGQDKAVSEVRDWVELPLLHPDLFAHVGVPTQVGVILYGPPGTGKTLLAQAVAGECQAHLEVVSGPEILSKWVGQSEENLRTLFERARRMAPSVILLDEIDAIAPARDRSLYGHEITLVSQLLTLMDGLYDRGQVVVIATTNRLESVDPALRRPGRFDYAISMVLPDTQGRQAIFERHLGRMAVADSVDLPWLAELTAGMSGADIAKVCRQAGMLCVKQAIQNGYHSVEHVKVEPRNLLAALEDLGRAPVTATAPLTSPR